MEAIVGFFRDTLSGSTYFFTVLICVFLIFSCIGYIVTKKMEGKGKKPIAQTKIN